MCKLCDTRFKETKTIILGSEHVRLDGSDDIIWIYSYCPNCQNIIATKICDWSIIKKELIASIAQNDDEPPKEHEIMLDFNRLTADLEWLRKKINGVDYILLTPDFLTPALKDVFDGYRDGKLNYSFTDYARDCQSEGKEMSCCDTFFRKLEILIDTTGGAKIKDLEQERRKWEDLKIMPF